MFGYSVASAGDVNGDGYGDVVVGAYRYSSGASSRGRADLYLGSSAGLSPYAAWSVYPGGTDANFGMSVASAGDVNGDGYGDVAVGAPAVTGGSGSTGRVHLYLGSAGGLSGTASRLLESPQGGAAFGRSVASAGDVNGDGFGDVVIGAYKYDNGSTDEGRAFLYLGSTGGLGATATWTAESDQDSAFFGISVASAGDVNGDGYGDVVVGAAYLDHGSTNEGQAYVYFGSSGGLSSSAGWTAESDESDGRLGFCVAPAGDVNGDGFGDVLVGAENANGKARVYLGSASGLAAGASWTSVSTMPGDNYAYSAASAGDVNGDGYGDVIVGAWSTANGQTAEGRASLFYGNGADGTGLGLARAAQARRPGLSTPIAPGLTSNSTSGFDVAMANARGPWGRAKVKLQIETKPLGTAFNGTGLTTSSSFTSTGLTGAAIQQTVSGLTTATGYHWRARVLASPAEGRPQGWGAWMVGGLSGSALGGHVYTAGTTYYADTDGDGYGNAAAMTTLRGLVAGWAANANDCDDASSAVHPGAAEVCNGVDDDCDGSTDPSTSIGAAAWHVDADLDAYGFPGAGTVACAAPPGMVADATDCDDASAAVFPGAPDTCNGIDDDCDGAVDGETTNLALVGDATWHVAFTEAELDAGTWEPTLSPAAAAFVYSPASIGRTFSAWQHTTTQTLWAPEDMWGTNGAPVPPDTGWGPRVPTEAWFEKTFTLPAGAVITSAMVTTVVDDDHTLYVNGTLAASDTSGSAGPVVDTDIAALLHEGPNTIRVYAHDNDSGGGGWLVVDGTILYVAPTSLAPPWHPDTDADGYGDALTSVVACMAPSGWLADASDCDDADDIVHPGAAEFCDGFDNDCDGSVDPTTAVDAYTWYTDADEDGFGNPALAVVACVAPAFTSLNDGDCDDTNAAISPDGVEACNGVDDDCNTLTDEAGATGETPWYGDSDADGYGNPGSSVSTCDMPSGYVSDATDCDDGAAVVHPGATETCNHVDDDCDGVTDESGATGETTFFVDADFDTYGDPARTIVTCWEGAGAAADDDDCDDTLASVHPAALEYCNETDDDCNGITDDPTAEDAVVYYRDVDGDGYGGRRRPVLTCEQPSGYSPYSTDCRDNDPTAWPGAPEACDGADDDCDTVIDEPGATIQPAWYTDNDTDGYGSGAATYACIAPPGLDDDALDCNDGVATVNPAAIEVCDSLDNNCDGFVDPSTAVDAATWHPDADGDSYGVTGGATTACTAPSGYLANATDCDDAMAAVHPGASEVCNSLDDNCDGDVDPSTSVGAPTWHADADNDGYGASSVGTPACTAPAGYLADGTDCDDAATGVQIGRAHV